MSRPNSGRHSVNVDEEVFTSISIKMVSLAALKKHKHFISTLVVITIFKCMDAWFGQRETDTDKNTRLEKDVSVRTNNFITRA